MSLNPTAANATALLQPPVAAASGSVSPQWPSTELPAHSRSVLVEAADQRRFRIVTVALLQDFVVLAPMCIQVAGKIQLIGLEDIKTALGARWPALAQRAMETAETIIRRRCGPHDTFSRTEDSSFIVCFADAAEEEASFRAAVIAREIRARLIGQSETAEAAHVSAVTASIQVPNVRGALRYKTGRDMRCTRPFSMQVAIWSRSTDAIPS